MPPQHETSVRSGHHSSESAFALFLRYFCLTSAGCLSIHSTTSVSTKSFFTSFLLVLPQRAEADRTSVAKRVPAGMSRARAPDLAKMPITTS